MSLKGDLSTVGFLGHCHDTQSTEELILEQEVSVRGSEPQRLNTERVGSWTTSLVTEKFRK